MQKASQGFNARYKVLYNVPESPFIIHRFTEKKAQLQKKTQAFPTGYFCNSDTLATKWQYKV